MNASYFRSVCGLTYVPGLFSGPHQEFIVKRLVRMSLYTRFVDVALT